MFHIYHFSLLHVRLAARVTVQQVTCRTSPTGECGKLLAVPERGQASCLSRCWFNTSKIFNFLKMLTREMSTTCRSPSKWRSCLKILQWLSHLCFFSGKALLQHIWTFIQEKENVTSWKDCMLCEATWDKSTIIYYYILSRAKWKHGSWTKLGRQQF